jgi:hypothetical protein
MKRVAEDDALPPADAVRLAVSDLFVLAKERFVP